MLLESQRATRKTLETLPFKAVTVPYTGIVQSDIYAGDLILVWVYWGKTLVSLNFHGFVLGFCFVVCLVSERRLDSYSPY